MINEVEYYNIDPKILSLNDNRIKKYKTGEWTQEELLDSITDKDPFFIVNGWLKYKDEMDNIVATKFIEKKRRIDELNPVKLWKMRKKIVKRYPKLQNIINKIERNIESYGHETIGFYRRVTPFTIEIINKNLNIGDL